MASYSFLEPFMEFFQCGGQDLQTQIILEEEPSSGPAKEQLPTSTSIYSLPSRESMTEIRKDSINRFAASPLFAFTSSVPMQFTFDGEDENNDEMDKRDDSLRITRVRSVEGSQFVSNKRTNSMTTVSTADNSSIVDIRRTGSEEMPEYQLQFVAERE